MTAISRRASGVPVPNLPELADLPYAAHLTAHEGELSAREDYDTVLFEGLDLAEPSAPSAKFLECAFTRVSMAGGRMQRANLRDVWMRDVRMTGTNLAESNWLDVTVTLSALAGAQVFGAELRRVVFSGCKLDSVNFRGTSLTDVTFDRCVLRDVDFADAVLTRCAFAGSQLSRTDFSRARMDRTDLRGAELGIVIDSQSLRGAIISTGQLVVLAPVLAESMGVIVRDD
jgi:uncharacterized protein YjbI with pentapeptide repeats